MVMRVATVEDIETGKRATINPEHGYWVVRVYLGDGLVWANSFIEYADAHQAAREQTD